MEEEQQTKLCALFKTSECEKEQHKDCYEIYGSTELNLEAKCTCDCHSGKKKKQPLAHYESKLTALDIGQPKLDVFGLGSDDADGNKRNTRQ